MRNDTRVQVMLIEPHRTFANSLSSALRVDGRFEIVAAATDGDAGWQILENHSPDLLLSEVDPPGRSPFEMVEELRRRPRPPRVVLMTSQLTPALVEQALRVSVDAYLLKSEPIPSLLDALDRVAHGQREFSPPVQGMLSTDATGRLVLAAQSPLGDLTLRQVEILRHLAAGRSVKEVARLMHLSMKSVDSHKYRIMQRLNIHNRVELAHFARRKGLLVD